MENWGRGWLRRGERESFRWNEKENIVGEDIRKSSLSHVLIAKWPGLTNNTWREKPERDEKKGIFCLHMSEFHVERNTQKNLTNELQLESSGADFVGLLSPWALVRWVQVENSLTLRHWAHPLSPLQTAPLFALNSWVLLVLLLARRRGWRKEMQIYLISYVSELSLNPFVPVCRRHRFHSPHILFINDIINFCWHICSLFALLVGCSTPKKPEPRVTNFPP